MNRIQVLVMVAMACFILAKPAQPAGVLVRVESLSGGSFNPGAGERNTLNFAITMDTTTNVTIRVFNMAGAMLIEKKIDGLKEGQYKFTWDGRDAKGKLVEPGFYKYELVALTANRQRTDNDNTIVEVRKGKAEKPGVVRDELPPALYEIAGVPSGYSLAMDIRGHVRSSTGANTGGINWNREELFLNLKGGYGPRWIYDFSFFPSYTKDQAFPWNNLVYSALIGYRCPWGAFDIGYRNYMEGYNDPLRLLSDYMMGSDRISLTAKLNLLERLYIGTGIHRLCDLNQSGFDIRATYEIFNGIRAGFFLVSNYYSLYTNSVVGGDARVDLGGFTPASGTIFTIQFARNMGSTQLNTTTASTPFGGIAVRFEADHRMFYLPRRAGDLTIKFAAQNVGRQFVADYGDIPNGIDSTGTELGFDYFINPGLAVLRSFRNELRAIFLSNGNATTGTNKFREYVSAGFTEDLSFIAQYEQSAMDNRILTNTAPICRNYTTYGELRYFKPGGKLDMALRVSYTADTFVALTSSSEYASTRFLAKFQATQNIRPYIAYERVYRFYGAGLASNQNYHHIMPGIEWTIIPATRTEIVLQGGYVINNLLANSATYYFKLGHYFLEKLSTVLTIGSQTSIDPAFRAYLEIKWEF